MRVIGNFETLRSSRLQRRHEGSRTKCPVDVDKCEAEAHLRRAQATKFLWTQKSFLTSDDAFAPVRQAAWFESLLDQAGDA